MAVKFWSAAVLKDALALPPKPHKATQLALFLW